MRNRLLMAATALSLLANVYLAERLLLVDEHPRYAETEPSASAVTAASPVPVAGREEPPASTSSEPQRPFHWSQVESDDIAVYARNLSRAGFPQEVIRDALVPLVNQTYAAVVREHARYAFPPRWAEAPKDVAERSARAIDQAQQARRATLETVFGLHDYQAQGYKPWNFNIHQVEPPQIEQSERERLNAMKKERNQHRESLKAKGLRGAELESALQPLIDRQEAELSTFLPADTVETLLTTTRR